MAKMPYLVFIFLFSQMAFGYLTPIGGGGGGSSIWGQITGILSNQTDLQTALNGKAPIDHINAFGNSGATPALDFSTGSVQTVTLTNNAVFSLTNGTAGRAYVVRILGGSGGFSIAMTNVTWLNATAGGSPPGAPTSGKQVDVSLLCVDGTNYDGSFTGNY